MKKTYLIGTGWLGEPLFFALKHRQYDVLSLASSIERKLSLQQKGIAAISLLEADTNEDVERVIITIPPLRTDTEMKRHSEICHLLSNFTGQVILTSSISVYSDAGMSVTEESPLNDSFVVGVEKLYSEHVQSLCILRLGGLFGPNREPARFGVKTDPEAPVNMLHLDDAIAAIEFAISHSLEGVYNVVHPDHPNRKVFYSNRCEKAGVEPPAFQISNEALKTKLVSTQKLIDLGFRFVHSSLLHYP